MKSGFHKQFREFKKTAHLFGLENKTRKKDLIRELAQSALPEGNILVEYFNVLLYVAAHPDDKSIQIIADRELNRISTRLLKQNKSREQLVNSGLPFVPTVTGFSHDLLRWLYESGVFQLKIEKYKNASLTVSEALRFTLPSIEKEETSAGYDNEAIFTALKISEKEKLPFLVNELSRLNHVPYLKDLLFDGMGIFVRLHPKKKEISRAFNRFLNGPVFYHDDLLKKFDHEELLDSKLPSHEALSENEKEDLVATIRYSLTLGARETDTSTYMDINSLRYYLLERGIAIAIYGMTPDRQLPLESYVGYTLFKNGFPAAYGGGWVFGQRSLFGINIADSFRGGESGYIMCQLLRVYRQVFGVDYFEVEPYQYGYDNSEGIKSGAFWFYYRYGFRLLDRKLRRLAEQENKKINAGKNYRTPEKTLLKFTESNMALNLGNEIPLQVSKVTEKTTMLFKSKYKNDRVKAEEEIVRKFISRAGETEIDNKFEEQVLREVALFSEVMNIHDPDKIALLRQMIKTKPYDLYLYQELLLKLLSKK